MALTTKRRNLQGASRLWAACAILIVCGGCDDAPKATSDATLVQTSRTARLAPSQGGGSPEVAEGFGPSPETTKPAAAPVALSHRGPETPATPSPASGGGLANGRYVCKIWMGNSLATLGVVEVRDGAYRGPSHNPSGPFTPLRINASGQIAWAPNFSQLAATGAVIKQTTVSKSGFTVDYTTRRGWSESMDCDRE